MTLFLAPLGIVPALVLMAWLDRLDAKRPEPRSALRRVTIAGIVSCIPAIIIEASLSKVLPEEGVVGALLKAFVMAALVEEVAKALCVRWFVWNRPEFDERMDGITYGTRAGLGFALFENVIYLLGAKSLGAFIVMFVSRAILAVPGHAIYGGFMGYYAARKRFDGTGPGLAGGLTFAILLHGLYDGALFVVAATFDDVGPIVLLLLLVPVGVLVFGGIALRRMARTAIALDDAAAARALAAPPRAQ
jgi:RsiW-degrading membrane proteinase PrsW (M82 family)